MKIIKILGGLGNQMFQYALYLAIKDRYKDEKTIFGKIDRNANENSSPRIRFQGDLHHEYVKWINQNFNLNDVLKIKHNSKYCLDFFK
jgi:hypothetical protein